MKNTTNHHLLNSFFSQFGVVFLKGIDCQGKFNKYKGFLWNTDGSNLFFLDTPRSSCHDESFIVKYPLSKSLEGRQYGKN